MRHRTVLKRTEIRAFGDSGRPERSWLLGSTALVAGLLMVGVGGWTGVSAAADTCIGGNAFSCSGVGSNHINLSATGDFSVSIGSPSPFQLSSQNAGTGTAFTIDANGYSTNEDGIHLYAGSFIDHTIDPETGIGMAVYDPGQDVEIQVDGTQGATPQAYIKGTTGLYLEGDSGRFHVANFGHIGGITGSGIDVSGLSEDGLVFDFDNHSYASTIGANNGVWIHDGVQSTQINNGGGLIAGLNDNGILIEDNVINGAGDRSAVQINNGGLGIITGYDNGISIPGHIQGTNEEGIADVNINNDVYYDVVGGMPHANPGGLIFGYTADGISIDGGVDGHVGINNSGTRGFTVDPSTLGLDPLVYGSGGLIDQLANSAGLSGRIPLGIYGADAGIYVFDVGNGVDINNGAQTITEAWTGEGSIPISQPVGGGAIVGYYDGVVIEHVGGWVNVNNGNDGRFIAGDFGNTGGLIMGQNEDGVGVYIDTVNSGGVNVENTGGTIWGSLNGVEVSEVRGSSDGVFVNNGAGRIVGHDSIGVLVYDTYNASVNNWVWPDEAPMPSYGGQIIGSQQGIVLAADYNNSVGNGPGGAILGAGYEGTSEEGYSATPVIEFHSDTSGNNSLDNFGLVSSWVVPHFAGCGCYTISYNGSAVVEDPGYMLDQAAIVADVKSFGTFAWTGGQSGSLTNNNTPLSDYQTAAQALAVQSTGFGMGYYSVSPGGEAHITNEAGGLLFGRVELANGSEDGGTSVDNFGVWYTQDNFDTGDYQGGYGLAAALASENETFDVIHNAGLTQTAFNAATNESATFLLYSGEFDNGAYYSNSQDGLVPANGLLSSIDGGVGDAMYIVSDVSNEKFGAYEYGGFSLYDGGYFQGSVNGALTSFVGLDINLGPGTAEDPTTDDWSDPSLWRSDRFATGYLAGTTGLIFNKINTTTTNRLGDTIIVAHANQVGGQGEPGCAAETCAPGDPLYIAPQSNGYASFGGSGLIVDGAYGWYLHATGQAPDPDYVMVSDWTPADVQLPGLVTAAQNAWYETAGVVADHVYGNHFPQAGEGGGGADLPVGIEPPAPEPTSGTISVWGKASGEHFGRSTSVVQTLGGITSTVNTSLVQDTFSLLAGADYQPNGKGDGLRAGVLGGVLNSGLSFNAYGATATYTGGTFGGYAAYTNNGFYVDGEARLDVLSMTYMNAGLNATGLSTSLGLMGNTGYRIQMSDFFVEPVASAAFVTTSIQNLTLGGATVSFSNGQSFRLGAGAKLGTYLKLKDDLSVELVAQGKIWNEFGPANKITISDGLGNSNSFTDGISGLFAEVSGTATFYNDDKTLSGFVSVGDKFNTTFNSASIKAGVRKSF